MTTDLKPTGPEREKSPWFQVGQFLLLVALVVAFFCLVKAWCATASFKAAVSTGTATSNNSEY